MLVFVLASSIALSGCAGSDEDEGDGAIKPQAVTGGAGSGGGSVSNAVPTFQGFTGSLSTGDNSGSSAEVFSGTLFDANGERDFDLGTIKVTLSGAATGIAAHSVTSTERTTLTEPASFGSDGFKVWTATANDGVLLFKYRYAYVIGTAPGTYTFTPSVTPDGGSPVTGTADSTTISVFSEITVGGNPVAEDGSTSAGAWGGWTASPGATNVESVNYVKLTNTGQLSDAIVVLDFTEANFTGSDANFTIPITSNVQFAWWEDTSPSTTAPSEGTFNYLAASADGSVTVTFTGLNNVIYVKYRIVEVPAVVASQTYSASYTATEL